MPTFYCNYFFCLELGGPLDFAYLPTPLLRHCSWVSESALSVLFLSTSQRFRCICCITFPCSYSCWQSKHCVQQPVSSYTLGDPTCTQRPLLSLRLESSWHRQGCSRGVARIFGLGGRPCRVEPDPASTEVAKQINKFIYLFYLQKFLSSFALGGHLPPAPL